MLLSTFILENEFYNSENLNNMQLSEEGQVYTYFLQTFTFEEWKIFWTFILLVLQENADVDEYVKQCDKCILINKM